MKAVVRTSARVQHRPAPRGNERRLVTQHPRRRVLSLAAGAAAMPAVSRIAWAQAYPTRPITMIVPGTAEALAAAPVARRLARLPDVPLAPARVAAGPFSGRSCLVLLHSDFDSLT
jgi:hypothetical protein